MSARRVLVTGSTRGIGRAIALRLGRDGFSVTVHGRKASDTDLVVQEIIANGGQASAMQFDVTDRQYCREQLEQDVEKNGAYYGIVCNAGVARDSAFPALSDEDWDVVLNTSLGGFYNVVHPLTMPMVRAKQGGRIVTIASVSGVMGNRGQVNYSAAKAGVIGATKALSVELSTRRITVNCVAPGLIETEMIGDAPLDEALRKIPMNRAGRPEEVAALVAFLMSDDAGYITRQVLNINGGMV